MVNQKRIMEPKKLTWVQKQGGAGASFAVHAGVDSGKPLYVIRASHLGGIVPGKLHTGHACGYISYDGREHIKQTYEVLTSPQGALSWVRATAGNIPNHAVVGGKDPNGDLYYIGRATMGNTVTVGKIHPRYKTCYVPYDGKEHEFSSYEILVRNDYGVKLNV